MIPYTEPAEAQFLTACRWLERHFDTRAPLFLVTLAILAVAFFAAGFAIELAGY